MMERDVNLKLVYIILILLLALVCTSVFYQIRYNDMKSAYEKSFEDFNDTLKNITIKQKDLYNNISGLNVSANRELTLATKLETRTLELENISRELSSLQQELVECQQNYDTVSTSSAVSNKILQRLIGTLRNDVVNGANETVILHDFKNIDTELKSLNS